MNKIRMFLCNFLGWHFPKKEYMSFDGCSLASICKYCEKEILQDSQGNWFSI